MPDSSPITAVHALGVYAEALASGRRVIVVGDATDGLAARIASFGARVVHVYDPDAARAATASPSRGVTVRALPPSGDFEVRDGAFDLAIVPDLAAVADPAALLARLRRLVGAEGAAIVAARNPEVRAEGSLDYYELYDLVALQFASVRMIGQVPFYGVTLAELGEADGAPQVSVDTQLVPEADAPEAFIALAAQEDVRLDPYAIVQLPAPAERVERVADRAVATAANAALAEAQLRAELLHSQLEEQRARVREIEARAGDERARAERLAQDQRALEEELTRQRERALRLARDLEDEKKLRTKLEIELGTVRKSPELAASRSRVSELEEALRASEVAVSALHARVAELEVIAAAAAATAQQVPDLLAELEATRAIVTTSEAAAREIASLGEDLERLETALRERGQAIAALEQEVLRRERMIHELVGSLEDARDRGGFHEPAQNAGEPLVSHEQLDALQRKLDALAIEVARREGDLQASAWRIAELEQEVAAQRAEAAPATIPPPPGAEVERELAAARDEIDVLKQALAQEHEARKKSESGEALAKAHAELERQAVLIEQLSRELEARDAKASPRERSEWG